MKNGFTLIEVLVTSVIIVALGLSILGLQTILSRSRTFIWSSFLNTDQADSNLKTMVKEIRAIQIGEDGSYPLEQLDDQAITFYSDIDYDGQVERVRYLLTNTEFQKAVTQPSGDPLTYLEEDEKITTLTADVQNHTTPVFYYYNSDWPVDDQNNPLDASLRLTDTQLIKIYLRLNTKDDPQKDYILESYVQPRLLKNNL